VSDIISIMNSETRQAATLREPNAQRIINLVAFRMYSAVMHVRVNTAISQADLWNGLQAELVSSPHFRNRS
jgi:hypothetical protein